MVWWILGYFVVGAILSVGSLTVAKARSNPKYMFDPNGDWTALAVGLLLAWPVMLLIMIIFLVVCGISKFLETSSDYLVEKLKELK